ncbi:MAG TPA: DUF6711 family protein [Tissierellaceae bacterium]|nr:DUF6711 family protein [Tissierellaceae bacterium]
MITINGVKLPTPAKYRNNEYDVDAADSGRVETGVMKRTRVRQGVQKIEASWNALTESQLRIILKAIEPSSMSVKFYSTKGMITRRMYVGDRTAELTKYYDSRDRRWDLSLNLIEF